MGNVVNRRCLCRQYSFGIVWGWGSAGVRQHFPVSFLHSFRRLGIRRHNSAHNTWNNTYSCPNANYHQVSNLRSKVLLLTEDLPLSVTEQVNVIDER